MQLRGLLKEQTTAECKEKASPEGPGIGADGPKELKRSEALQAETKGQVIRPSTYTQEKTSKKTSDGEAVVPREELEGPSSKGQLHGKVAMQKVSRVGRRGQTTPACLCF